jgi:stearoyl-CoA 9-desaturase NADPH oxidoreductase
MSSVEPNATGWKAAAAAVARHLFLDRQAEFWLGELDRTRSLTETRARVVKVVCETRDVKTFVLRPSARWQGHRAGQYTTIEVEIDGVRTRRCYSLSSAPGEQLAITVKRVPGGRVSGWMHDHVRVGHVLVLGVAGGDFVLPTPAPPKLLLLSGGSGVTPVMSILRDLAARDAVRDVVFVHHARSRADVAFRADLQAMAARHPGLRLVLELDDAPDSRGGFDEKRLAERVPDFADRATFLCGPTAFMERVERMWKAAGLADRLTLERFVAPGQVPRVAPGADAQIVTIRLARAGTHFAATSASPLLDQLERAGERPAHGCRMGICHSCTCRKTSGAVRNLITGAISDAPDEDIQLCISVPQSDVELSL